MRKYFHNFTRPGFIIAGITLCCIIYFYTIANSLRQEHGIEVSTHSYKKIDSLEIELDVYRNPDKSNNKAAVWIHGGALITGSRKKIDIHLRKYLLDAGYTLFSIDYRLAPESKLPEVIEDIEDAIQWIRKEGATLYSIDADRLAVIGGSAGGYLALVAGYKVIPNPTVLLSLWGYGDLIGDWYSQPSSHIRHNRVKMSRESAFAQVNGPAIANVNQRKGNGYAFYLHCRQNGIWPHVITGWDPILEAEKFFPFMPIKNVTSVYPPTFLIHGTEDTDVPYEQSAIMARQLQMHSVPHKFVTIKGGEHGLGGADESDIAIAYKLAFEFIHYHMNNED